MTGGQGRAFASALPIGAVLVSMTSIQAGAAIIQHLFPLVGPQGAVALRVVLAAAILLAVRRPSLKGVTRPQLAAIALYGLSLGAMNLSFYLSLRTLPLGVAVAVEFTGPLVLAALSHRSRLDILWLVLAAAGLVVLAPFGKGAVDPVGLMFGLGAGVFWALYIFFGQKAGEAGGAVATSWGMVVAAVLVFPFGLAQAGTRLFDPALLPLAFAVAVLSSAFPYTLEMFALSRLPKATFGTILSLAPAAGALAGFLLLGQHLTPRQGIAIASIIVASGGAALSFVRAKPDAVPPVP